jgi:hypothetical protein
MIQIGCPTYTYIQSKHYAIIYFSDAFASELFIISLHTIIVVQRIHKNDNKRWTIQRN